MWQLIFGGVTSTITEFFKAKREETLATHKFRLAELENKTRLMSDTISNNAAWEMAALRETGRALKWASFVQLTAPIVLTMFGPLLGLDVTAMWEALALVPKWWQNIYIGANATIWGTLQMRDMGGLKGIVKALSKDPVQEAQPVVDRNSIVWDKEESDTDPDRFLRT